MIESERERKREREKWWGIEKHCKRRVSGKHTKKNHMENRRLELGINNEEKKEKEKEQKKEMRERKGEKEKQGDM